MIPLPLNTFITMIKILINWFKEDPKDAFQSTAITVLAFLTFYAFIWLGAILQG